MIKKLLGPSWKGAVYGAVFFLGGVGAIVARTAFGATPAGLIIEIGSEGFALLGGALGIAQSKNKSVSNSPTPLAIAEKVSK